jgi:uncharacterized membrane protein YbhN (UPF0104 family)
MQFKQIAPYRKEKVFRSINIAIRIATLIAVALFIYVKLEKDSVSFENTWRVVQSIFTGDSFWVIILILLLMLANWLTEAWKWKVVAAKIENLSIWQALKGVLTGLSLGFVTPHSWGDYAGRIWQMEENNREKALGGILLSRGSQLAITLIFGIPGFLYLLSNSGNIMPGADNLFLFLCFAFAIITPLCILYIGGISSWLGIFLGHFRWFAFLAVLNQFTPNDSLKLLAISLLRYLIFSSQFLIVLLLFKVELPVELLSMGIGFIFLAKSVIPAFNFLSDLGVREFSALLFFDTTGVDPLLIISASLFIWIVNILLPTIVGTAFVFSMKTIRTED